MSRPRRSAPLPFLVLLLAVGGATVTACADDDAPGTGATSPPAASIPSDASLVDFCYAMSGITSEGFDAAGGELVQERIALLKETGAPEGAPSEVHRAITTLVEEIEKLGDAARPDDLDPVEDRVAPSPYDDPEGGLRDYWEDNCDGVYTEEFESPGQGDTEDVIDNQIRQRNEHIRSGACDRLAEIYSTAGGADLVEDVIHGCSTGSGDDSYRLVGGGVTGPDTAEAVIATADGTTFTNTMVLEDGTWKLTIY